MNVGFSNLDTLKKYLLAGSSAKNDTRFDAVIQLLGLGMAAAVENFCSRRLARVVDDTAILPADKCQFLLPRYPVESISAIDIKTTEAEGWVAQSVNDFLNTIDLEAGIVNCPDGADAGPWYAKVRFTYTGGYWWEMLDPDDTGYPTTQPAGSTALPAELRLAWLMQCETIWSKRDKLGTGLVDNPDAQSKISTIELAPLVKQTIGQFVRYNLV